MFSVAVAVRIKDYVRVAVRMPFSPDLFRIRVGVSEETSFADGVLFDCKAFVALPTVGSRRMGSCAVAYG